MKLVRSDPRQRVYAGGTVNRTAVVVACILVLGIIIGDLVMMGSRISIGRTVFLVVAAALGLPAIVWLSLLMRVGGHTIHFALPQRQALVKPGPLSKVKAMRLDLAAERTKLLLVIEERWPTVPVSHRTGRPTAPQPRVYLDHPALRGRPLRVFEHGNIQRVWQECGTLAKATGLPVSVDDVAKEAHDRATGRRGRRRSRPVAAAPREAAGPARTDMEGLARVTLQTAGVAASVDALVGMVQPCAVLKAKPPGKDRATGDSVLGGAPDAPPVQNR